MVHRGHENLSDRWGDRYAPVVFWVGGISLAFIKGDDLSCAPRLGGSGRNGTGVHKAG